MRNLSIFLAYLTVGSVSALQQSLLCPSFSTKPAFALALASHKGDVVVDVLSTSTTGSRRQALGSFFGCTAAVLTVAVENSFALDMDAFVNSQLEYDTTNCDPKKDPKCIPKLSQDEALCKYGQSGEARAEACKNVKAGGGSLPSAGSQGKSLGGAYAM